ncbi:hypothetical protein JRO89_XS01G0126200 [Xanthoceras sorbifolium]|uniref:Rho GDP-dissociation inhibitor 1 n=1 Tax=Xanthoceras sorbifolium TaxID=99658 RepID=A0ABQ8IJ04_9ROSI|nr:hypothetical protein JRO89_XS01G0126200 [Xanthoceras sorbifolium]
MSLAVGAVSSSRNMGFDKNKEKEGKSGVYESDNEAGEKAGKHKSEPSVYSTEDEEDEDAEGTLIQLGPHLRKWKEQLLGSVDFDNIGETHEPEVKILSLSIVAPGRSDIVLSVPEDGKPKGLWFTLKEGSLYSLKFSFEVKNNIASGLRLKHVSLTTSSSVSVDSSKQMLGTFSPQPEPYTFDTPEETTPSGMFARGSYTARTKFLDDDNRCYLEINYTFDIRKEWAAT